MAPQHHRTKDSQWRAPVLWGLGAALSAFAAVAVGLAGSGARLTAWQYLWVAVASLVPGVVAGSKAYHMNRHAQRSRHALTELRGQVLELTAELRQRQEDDEVERGTTAVTLGQLGATLAQVVTGAFVGSPHETREAAARFAQIVVEALHEVLGGDTGRARGPLRVLFLQHRGGREQGLDGPLPKPGGPPVLFTAKWAVGHRAAITWDIRANDDDADTAKRIMQRRPPWDSGTLVVDDVTKPEYTSGYCVLLPPDHDVVSYCRVGVTDEQRHHGILCLDAWRSGALTWGDEAVARSFAVLLAAGLTVAAALSGDALRLPGDIDQQGMTDTPPGRTVNP